MKSEYLYKRISAMGQLGKQTIMLVKGVDLLILEIVVSMSTHQNHKSAPHQACGVLARGPDQRASQTVCPKCWLGGQTSVLATGPDQRASYGASPTCQLAVQSNVLGRGPVQCVRQGTRPMCQLGRPVQCASYNDDCQLGNMLSIRDDWLSDFRASDHTLFFLDSLF